MRRQKRKTRYERRLAVEEDELAHRMEQALTAKPAVVHLDFETGQTLTGRMSSSQPNLQRLVRKTVSAEMSEHMVGILRTEYPDFAEYFWANPEFVTRASADPGMLAAIDILHKADYASIEKHVLGYIQDSSDSRARYEALLLSSFGDDPLAKVVELDEKELREVGEEAMAVGRAIHERAT